MNIIIMNIFQYTRDLNFKIIIFIYYYYERINSNKIWTLKIFCGNAESRLFYEELSVIST